MRLTPADLCYCFGATIILTWNAAFGSLWLALAGLLFLVGTLANRADEE